MKKSKLVLILTALLSCAAIPTRVMAENRIQSTMEKNNMSEATKDIHEIYLAGGCFWGIEAYMERAFTAQKMPYPAMPTAKTMRPVTK